jgi:replicative DNA helicase
VGGPVFLAGLSEQVGFATNAEYYARLVHDKARLRRFLDKTQQVAAACFGPIQNTSQFLDRAVQELYEVAGTGVHNQIFHLDNLVQSETQVIERIYEKHQQPGIPVGYRDLGKLFSWVPGDLVILAARPSMGKTALALNFAWRIAKNGIPGLIFTLETSKEQITRRFMSLVGRINGYRMNQGKLTNEEWERFYQIHEQVNQMPILIDDTPSLSVAEIRTRTRRQFGNGSPGFVVVDYLQLTKPLRRSRSREEEVAEVSRGLKSLAKELNLPVLAISSLNRKLEERPDKRPKLADLRESGAIEFDADLILFLYRDEVYKKETPAAGGAEVNVAKHKNGPIGTVKLAYQKEIHRFEDLAEEVGLTKMWP